MKIEDILKLSEKELEKYCLSIENEDEDGWQEVSREEGGYFREGSKFTIYYFDVEWERDGYTLSYYFSEHSEDWGEDEIQGVNIEIKKDKTQNYVVGYLSFFENDLKLFKIYAESEYEAIKKAMVDACSKEEYKQSEIEWQNSEDYPKDKDSLIDLLFNSDIAINILKV